MKLLLAEDERSLSRAVVKILEKNHYTVDAVYDGEEAMDYLAGGDYELKYLLTKEQKETIINALVPHMVLDEYGRTTIRNIYFDTDSYRLIRHSIEKPAYKEKLRIRRSAGSRIP